MKILLTGACGFVGSRVAESLKSAQGDLEIIGLDNFSRPGSETNRVRLNRLGIKTTHADIRMTSDLGGLPKVDWVIDAAANPSVLAGIDQKVSPRQLFEHNLLGTLEVLEYCRSIGAGLILLSTNRVYSIAALNALPLQVTRNGFVLDDSKGLPNGVSPAGIDSLFDTSPPISLYGTSKLASELLALEYGAAFGLPVWINRCGLLAGAGQFGTAENGIISYWIHGHCSGARLRYTGYEGLGYQTRDVLHPRDLTALIRKQMSTARSQGRRLYTAGGGSDNAISLAQLTDWCNSRFPANLPEPDLRPRPFDVPWLVMDNSDVHHEFGWEPETSLSEILSEIAEHAEATPGWLQVCAGQ
ncbi:MAG: NAD-dependent epimerase/dehydratase family protein [Bryobacteraceae bacterium]|nr:NAD-dependent epimerase/dehydratase family protein [Bryobacteraceae bacterium]